MSDFAVEAASGHWQIGSYRFTRYSRRQKPVGWLWGCAAHGRGVDFCRDPLTAFVALRRFQKVQVPPHE